MTRKDMDAAIGLARADDFLHALTLFVEIYGTQDAPPIRSAKDAVGLSYFGLCVALVKKEYKAGVELCKRAIDLEFYNGDHYANLARVYAAGGKRKQAVDTAEAGLRVNAENEYLLKTRRSLGVRSRPIVPFLNRSHPINVQLGAAKYAKKQAEPKRKK